MSEQTMKRLNEAWYKAHPPVGVRSAGVPAVTFMVINFRFDSDGTAATQVDTAKIIVGQTVGWEWFNGIHTVTNGQGSLDPAVGTLFDQPSDSSNPQFSFTFHSAGTFPFFCRTHEGDNMSGVVVVRSATGAPPSSPGGALGFTATPAPNPTRAGVRFRYALREPGRARAQVFDARGRLVAVVLDRDLGAGSYSAACDGRDRRGALAAPGVYYLRLSVPRATQSQRFVVAP